MNLSPDDKIAGVLAPLFALRTEDDLGVGDVAALRQFIDWSRALGFRLVQLLPINETGGDNSPYNAISSRAIEPTTLHLAPGSPEDLSAEAFAEVTAGVDLAALRRGSVKYEIVKPLKRKLLERAFDSFRARRNADLTSPPFAKRKVPGWADYTFFRVLMELNGERETWDRVAAGTNHDRSRASLVRLVRRRRTFLARRAPGVPQLCAMDRASSNGAR